MAWVDMVILDYGSYQKIYKSNSQYTPRIKLFRVQHDPSINIARIYLSSKYGTTIMELG